MNGIGTNLSPEGSCSKFIQHRDILNVTGQTEQPSSFQRENNPKRSTLFLNPPLKTERNKCTREIRGPNAFQYTGICIQLLACKSALCIEVSIRTVLLAPMPVQTTFHLPQLIAICQNPTSPGGHKTDILSVTSAQPQFFP
jgi:hypothetical protein